MASYSVRIDDNFSEDAIALTHPEHLQDNLFVEGSYVEISVSDTKGDLILRVTALSNKGNKWEATVSKVVAEHLGLNSLSSRINLSPINSKDIELEFAMVTIKKLFLQRGDIMRFKESIRGKILYLSQLVTSDFAQAQVQELVKEGKMIKCGIVSPQTKLVCRSKSTRIFWLVQISAEMWEFDEKGNLFFEKFLQNFVEPILDMWKEKDVSHKLSVVFFSRTYYLNGPTNAPSFFRRSIRSGSSGLGQSLSESELDRPVTGFSYDDHFNVVLENVIQCDKLEIIRTLKEEFWNFVKIAGWRGCRGSTNYAVPSAAAEGNVLEAINITFNVLEKHYMDRDLFRTGNSLVMITAGTGFFQVDPKLAQITKQRMMDNGIGMDLVSLSSPPLHMVPLFYVIPQALGTGDFYEVPHWINLQYLNGGNQSRGNAFTKDTMKLSSSTSSGNLSSTSSTKPKQSTHRGNKLRQAHRGTDESANATKLPSDICWEGPSTSNHRWTGLEQLDRTNLNSNFIVDGDRFLLDRSDGKSNRKKKFPDGSTEDINMLTHSHAVPLIPDDPYFLFTPFPYSEIYSRYANLPNHFQSQFLPLTLCALPCALLKYISDQPSTSQQAASQDQLSHAAITIRGKVLFSKRNYPSSRNGSIDRMLNLIASSEILSYDKAAILNLMSSYDKEEGTAAYFPASPNTNAESQMTQPESVNLDVDHEEVPSGSKDPQYSKMTVSYPDGVVRTFITPNLDQERNIPHERFLSDIPLSSSESNLSYSPKKPNSYSRRAQSYSSSPGDGIHLTVSPAANCSTSLSSSFKPNLFLSSSLNVSQNFHTLHRNTSTASQPTARDKEAQSSSLDRTKERHKDEPITSYKYISSLPLSVFHKKRYGINPFHIEEGKAFLEMRSHNRRRWAHAFSSQIVEVNIATRYELNYPSLCQPAILPLSTDYIPSIEDIKNNYYTFCDYHLMIDPACSPYRNPESLLVEMINQRLAQDYQLVESNSMDVQQYKRFILAADDCKDTPDHNFIALSMGHRLQFLSYIPSKGSVQVHGFMSKIGVNDEKSGATYSYKLWSPYSQAFETTSQKFSQFPPEYSWNFTDEALLGNNEDLPESSKAKRIRFAVIPLLSQNTHSFTTVADSVIEEYKGAVEKLLAFIGSYSGDDKPEKFVVNYTSDVANQNYSEQRLKLWLSGGPKQPHISNPQWAYFVCSKSYSYQKAFHFRLEWIVCIGGLLEKLISTLFRRVSSIPLRVIEVPEYYCSSNLRVHPFRVPPVFKNSRLSLPNGVTRVILSEYPSLSTILERFLISNFLNDWIADQSQETMWEGFGVVSASKAQSLEIPEIKRLAWDGETNVGRNRPLPIQIRRGNRIFDKQYMHRRGYAVLRIGRDAIAWLPCSVPRVSDCATTKEESLEILRNFSQFFEDLVVCYGITISIVEAFLASI